MNPERWQQLKAVFVDLVERDDEDRASALASIEERDPSLAGEVRGLLRGYEEASTRLLAAPVMDVALTAERASLVGTRLGPYRLTSLVGGGGMGTVYEAIREEDGKRVAVKVLHHSEDQPAVQRQIIAERRILAALEHDNIARLIDGGVTADGLPYFTMELVEGLPIVAFCEQRRLDVAARLRLFRSLCAAVQYAHQRLVVHCDINRKLLGEESFSVAVTLFNLAETVAEEGHFAESEPLQRQTLALLRKLLGPDHPYCGKSLSGLAIALAALDRPEEAQAAGHEALAIQQQHQPQDPMEIAAAEIGLAVALASADKLDAAEGLARRAIPDAEDGATQGAPMLALETVARRYDRSRRAADAARCRALLAARPAT